MRLPRLGHKKDAAFSWYCLRCLPLEPSDHSVKKAELGDACVERSLAPSLKPASPTRHVSEQVFGSFQPAAFAFSDTVEQRWDMSAVARLNS